MAVFHGRDYRLLESGKGVIVLPGGFTVGCRGLPPLVSRGVIEVTDDQRVKLTVKGLGLAHDWLTGRKQR